MGYYEQASLGGFSAIPCDAEQEEFVANDGQLCVDRSAMLKRNFEIELAKDQARLAELREPCDNAMLQLVLFDTFAGDFVAKLPGARLYIHDVFWANLMDERDLALVREYHEMAWVGTDEPEEISLPCRALCFSLAYDDSKYNHFSRKMFAHHWILSASEVIRLTNEFRKRCNDELLDLGESLLKHELVGRMEG